MKVAKLSDLSKKDYERIVRRSFGTNRYIMPIVKKIIRDVVRNGDSVIINNYQKKYGIQNLDNLQVTQSDVKKAYSQVEKKTIQAIFQPASFSLKTFPEDAYKHNARLNEHRQ